MKSIIAAAAAACIALFATAVVGECIDDNERCSFWAETGECEKNPNYMKKNCRLSCKECIATGVDADGSVVDPNCEDDHENCAFWQKSGECDANPTYMHKHCRLSCQLCSKVSFSTEAIAKGTDLGIPQQIHKFDDGTLREDVQFIISKARNYMQKLVPSKFEPGMQDLCKNKHPQCSYWALLGECTNNARFMNSNCAPVCEACDSLTIEGRCPVDPDAPVAWTPGDLDKMFTRLTSEPNKSTYEVAVLSSPAQDGRPWIITLENVLSDLEAERLIELGSEQGYERSSDVGALKADGTHTNDVNNGRTSTNAWCIDKCMQDEVARNVTERLSNLTGIAVNNSEYLQLLQYEPGQFYRAHHDYIPHHVRRQQGVRILTLYLYLNDEGLEGGGTNFDFLNITVMPKRGRALLWPSVLNDEPEKKDFRTTHQALPVESGVKYGANAWFHLRDFRTPYARNCI